MTASCAVWTSLVTCQIQGKIHTCHSHVPLLQLFFSSVSFVCPGSACSIALALFIHSHVTLLLLFLSSVSFVCPGSACSIALALFIHSHVTLLLLFLSSVAFVCPGSACSIAVALLGRVMRLNRSSCTGN